MKKRLLNTGLILASMLFTHICWAQSSNGLHYTVIHHGANGIEIHETDVENDSDLTIESYISNLGFEAEDADIINVSNGSDFVSSDSEIWLINEEEDGSGSQTIEIMMDDENFDLSMEEIMQNATEEGEQQIIVKTIMLSDEESAPMGDLDIEELIEEAQSNISMVGSTEMDVRVEKTIDEEGNEITQMWVNGEEVDPETYDGNIHMFEIDGEGENDFIFLSEGECPDTAFMSDCMNFTIGIISPMESEEDRSMESQNNIENLSFKPRTQDQYELSFLSKDSAKTQIVLYDIQGKEIMNKNLGDFQGEYLDTISLGNMSSGTYVLNIIQNGERVVKKILVN